jgi:hypothetical protein
MVVLFLMNVMCVMEIKCSLVDVIVMRLGQFIMIVHKNVVVMQF